MRFFEDFKVPVASKIGITNLLSNITTRPDSHKGGWARLLKCQLINQGYTSVEILGNKNSLKEFDVIIFDLGAEYSGSLNMFGGLDEKVFKRLKEIKEFKGQLFSWRHELPDISILESRRTNASTCEAFKSSEAEFLGSVVSVLGTSKTFDHTYRTDSLLIGDSHTPSVWTPQYMIERRDGRTLKGMVERNTVSSYFLKFKEAGVKINQILVHCSSIDIRHHVMRESQPLSYILTLAQKLFNELTILQNTFGVSFNIVETMGIECVTRELPKTGYYKGTPYYGTWDHRNQVRNAFNRSLNLWFNGNQVKLPEYFFDQEGKLKFDVMEKPQSVHTSPQHYRWDLDLNKGRWHVT